MIFDSSVFLLNRLDFFEEAQEKRRIKQKELGEKVQENLVRAIEQLDPDAAETVDQAIHNVCNFAESVGNAVRQHGKYSPLLETPTLPIAIDILRKESATSQRITVSECSLADHLFRDGSGIGAVFYSHHAIYVGHGRVLHYAHDACGDICIYETTFEEFAEGYPVYRMNRAESPLRYSPEEAVRRAHSREWETEYNLLVNNCENFVRWCRCGKPD